jgi:hypothetical protein
MRKALLLLSLVLVSFPLLAGRDVSAVRYAPSDSSTGNRVVASSGDRFLTLSPVANHIFASLSDASGVSNSPAFAAVPYANASALAAIGTGSGYVAIWNERDNLPIFARFTSEGVLERRVPLARSRFSGSLIASNGSQIAIVDANGVTIDISFYDLDGNLLRRAPVTAFSGETYALTAAGRDFVVVTAGAVTGINEWRVTNDGQVQPPVRIQPPSSDPLRRTYGLAVAAKNGLIVTGWTEVRSGELSGTLVSATIQPDGTVRQSALLSGSGPPGGGLVILPVDRGYVMAWVVSPFAPALPGVFALVLDDAGNAAGQPSLLRSDGLFTAAASAGNTVTFEFTPFVSSPPTILTATVDATGIATRPTVPLTLPVRQLAPVLTGNGAGFTAAWLEQESGSKRIVAGRINVAGEPLDGTGIVLDLHATSAPVIAHGSSEELIVWMSNARLVATRLSSFGGVLDATPIDLAPLRSGSYDVAWNGSRFFVVWTDGAKFSGAFVAPDGAATSPRNLGVQTSSADTASALDVAWDGRQYILVYAEATQPNCTCFAATDHVRVMRISAAGDAIDTVPVRIPGVNFSAHVASSGSESLIVLDRAGGTSSVVVPDDGAALHLDPVLPLIEFFFGPKSDVAWDGSSYVVAVRYLPSATTPGWVAAIQVSRSGIPARTVITPAAGPPDVTLATPQSVATDAAGGTAFVISEVAPPLYVARVRLYLLSEFSPMPPLPSAPRNAVSYFGGTTARIDWQSDAGGDGFLIERSSDFGKSWSPFVVVPAEARTVSVNAKVGDQFRVRAFGPGGLSDGPITSIGSMFRHWAGRP